MSSLPYLIITTDNRLIPFPCGLWAPRLYRVKQRGADTTQTGVKSCCCHWSKHPQINFLHLWYFYLTVYWIYPKPASVLYIKTSCTILRTTQWCADSLSRVNWAWRRSRCLRWSCSEGECWKRLELFRTCALVIIRVDSALGSCDDVAIWVVKPRHSISTQLESNKRSPVIDTLWYPPTLTSCFRFMMKPPRVTFSLLSFCLSSLEKNYFMHFSSNPFCHCLRSRLLICSYPGTRWFPFRYSYHECWDCCLNWRSDGHSGIFLQSTMSLGWEQSFLDNCLCLMNFEVSETLALNSTGSWFALEESLGI